MIDISGNGTTVTIVAAKSFPMGFTVGQFADDVDPLVADDVEATGFEMLYDGSLFAFDKAAPIKLVLAVPAGSPDDINLKILLQSRKSSKSISPFPDTISAVVSYGDGGRIVLSNGALISGPLIDGIQSAGRKKGNSFTFMFGSFAGAQSVKQVISGIAQAAAGIL